MLTFVAINLSSNDPPPDGFSAFYDWLPAGMVLRDDGTGGDLAAGDHLFTWSSPFSVPSGLSGKWLFVLQDPTRSTLAPLWPFLEVR